MTTRAEDVLFASLTDIEALERVARFGLDPDVVPTEDLRPMVSWAIDYYFDSGQTQAPSREMLLQVWAGVLEKTDVELIDEAIEIDTISSAIEALVDHAAHSRWQSFIKDAAVQMANAGPTQKVATMSTLANQFFEITSRLQDRSNHSSALDGMAAALARYHEREELGETHRGMTFGWNDIDDHTFGIHPGELGVLAAGPKVGKSYFMCRIAINEYFKRDRRTALATLENTVEATWDRIACVHLGIDYRSWQRGKCSSEQIEMVRHFINDLMPEMKGHLEVFMPTRGQRTPERLVREAHMLGCDGLLVDQLTHVEHPDPGRKPRHEQFNDNIHQFADLAKTGRHLIPIFIAHQINRAGVEAGKKQDYPEMTHLAESAGIERAADWVFGLHQNSDERQANVARLYTLAARRVDIQAWRIGWNPNSSQQRVISTVTADGPPQGAAA